MSWGQLQGVGPFSRVGDKRRQDDDDDGRSDQGSQIGINSLNAHLGKNGSQRRKHSRQQRPIEPTS
jgi:hypothetical protein